MARQGRGIGFVMLVVVLAVVLLLVARAWESVAPTAAQLPAGGGPDGIDSHGEEAAAGELDRLPDLSESRQATDEHREQVREALENIE